jgi:hypothetical protein
MQGVILKAHVSVGNPSDATAESSTFMRQMRKVFRRDLFLPSVTTVKHDLTTMYSQSAPRYLVVNPQKPIKMAWNTTAGYVTVRGPLIQGITDTTHIWVKNASAYPTGNVVSVWVCGD